MANGATPTYVKPERPRPTTVNLVVNRLTFLGTVCALAGGFLIYSGYSQGELLIGIGISCAGNLGSILAKPSNTPEKVTIENPPNDPANVQEVKLEQPKPPIPEPTS